MSETPTQHPLKWKVWISRFDRFLHLFFLWHSGALKSHTSSLMKTWKPWRLWGLMQDDAMCFKVLREHGITSLSIWVSWNYPPIRIALDSWHNTVFEPGEVWIASEKLWRACGNKQTRENLCRSSMVRKIEPVVVVSLKPFVDLKCSQCPGHVYPAIPYRTTQSKLDILITKKWPGSGYHAVHTSEVVKKLQELLHDLFSPNSVVTLGVLTVSVKGRGG